MAQDRIYISFSSKNKDLYSFLKSQPNASDYVCEAVRFFRNHKDEAFIDKKIENLIDQKISEQLKDISIAPEVQHDKKKSLEENIENIKFEED